MILQSLTKKSTFLKNSFGIARLENTLKNKKALKTNCFQCFLNFILFTSEFSFHLLEKCKLWWWC